MFILRAQDGVDQWAVEIYKVPAVSHGSALAEHLDEAVERFAHWSGPKKIPD